MIEWIKEIFSGSTGASAKRTNGSLIIFWTLCVLSWGIITLNDTRIMIVSSVVLPVFYAGVGLLGAGLLEKLKK